MQYCIDTNVLLRSAQPKHPLFPIATNALISLTSQGHDICVFPQIVREFWNVASRPEDRNGLGFSLHQVELEVSRIEAAFVILEDGLAVYQEWRQLVVAHAVSGVQVHDCYLAASAKVRGINHLLTFNPDDFRRFGIAMVDPATV